ncbi:Asp-tRNA(Asn)/Glu-tRNA(Gln) amidotransferase subunit GatB [Candidatus Omnitrophota bacterium]
MYKTTIGLEIHLQLSTKTKAFCGCLNKFGQDPNTSVCPICLGFPGSLPVLNREYLKSAIKVALALDCDVADRMKFDRKNYFYPDLPKNFQISQYDMPLAKNGFVDIEVEGQKKRIGITRVHMEEDAGKLIHDENKPHSYVDYNRTGTPLLEIVSEPDIETPDEAYAYLITLKAILEYLNVSDCNMQEGSLRCDANISIRAPEQKELGVKVELKNMNTFKGVKQALEHEEKRQAKMLSSEKEIIQETRLWNENKGVSESMRSKEEAHDYRYFPEPDLVPFNIESSVIDDIRSTLPEMPTTKRQRFIDEYEISEYDSSVLVCDKAMSEFFESCLKLYDNPKNVVNWLMGDISKYINANDLEFKNLGITPERLTQMLQLIDSNVISGKIAKSVLDEMLSSNKSATDIVEAKGLTQISDESAIALLADEVIDENQKVVSDILSGNEKALGFLVGQLMKKTKGKANPQLANKLLKDSIERHRG